MHAKDARNVVALENAALAHALRAARGLLRRLEHEENVSGELPRSNDSIRAPRHAIDPCGRRKRHGHVAIVAAGMHATGVLARERRSARLVDGKRIHIRPDRRRLGATEVEKRAYRPLARLEDIARKPAEHAAHVGDGPRQVIVKFGNSVEVAAVARELVEELLALDGAEKALAIGGGGVERRARVRHGDHSLHNDHDIVASRQRARGGGSPIAAWRTACNQPET